MDLTAYDKSTVAVMLEHLYLGRKIVGAGPTQLAPAQVLQLLQLADQIKPPRVKLLHAFAEKVPAELVSAQIYRNSRQRQVSFRLS